MKPDIFFPELDCVGSILQDDPFLALGEIGGWLFQLEGSEDSFHCIVKSEDKFSFTEVWSGNIESGFVISDSNNPMINLEECFRIVSQRLRTKINDRDLFMSFWPEIRKKMGLEDSLCRIASAVVKEVDQSYIDFLTDLIRARRSLGNFENVQMLTKRKSALEAWLNTPILQATVWQEAYHCHSLYLSRAGTLVYHE